MPGNDIGTAALNRVYSDAKWPGMKRKTSWEVIAVPSLTKDEDRMGGIEYTLLNALVLTTARLGVIIGQTQASLMKIVL